MLKRVSFLISLVVVLTLTGSTLAQGPEPQDTAPTWQASYWNTPTLSGAPALQRDEVTLDYDWGNGSPAPGIHADGFSARWTRYIDVTPGSYRFTATGDDGIRVWLDSELIINEWYDHPPKTVSADRNLSAGHHWVVVEFYENGGGAVARVTWTPISVSVKNWRGEYFNNMSLSGAPSVTRDDATLNFDWGEGSPAPGVKADKFSARWTRSIDLTPGSYRFTATGDDGIRVWLDGELIVNEWYDHPPKTVNADKNLSAGRHQVVVEFYENMGGAVAKLTWGPTPATIKNWRGEYFNNMSLGGTPALARDDAQINFDWGEGSPAPSAINVDGFSVRWTRALDLPGGSYRFTATADDGVRVWVNDHLLINAWQDQAPCTYTGDIYLPGGPTPIKMEYYEHTGGAVARLAWTLSGSSAPGEVIVDDSDAGFVKNGSSTGWHTAGEGYKGNLTWTRNNDQAQANYNWAHWYPNLKPGRYEVFAFIPARYTTTAKAHYWVSHAKGYTLRIVDQSANGDRWVSLGTYQFDGTDRDYVSLSDITYEPRLSRLIAFDAIKWAPR